MEREEPKLGKVVPEDLEFRPRHQHQHQGGRRPGPAASSVDGLVWKLGVAVGLGVLAALLIFNAYERMQARRDAEAAVRYLEQGLKQVEKDLQGQATAVMRQAPAPSVIARPRVHPLPPGYRCSGGTLLTRQNGGWMNITERHNHWYCPETGRQQDCFRVTPHSVGCTS